MRRVRQSQQREPTIALINIVFLMLIFFMVAGTLSRPLDPSLTLIDTADLEGRAPPDALVVHEDGRLTYLGAELGSAADFIEARDETDLAEVRVLPDRALDARMLVALGRDLRAAGAERVLMVTERVTE
ncbi:ExbD/TolR family protein [Palleronia sp. LCG004]|uniref:ExbD/TolR family protein n=1 Tax=Palleronia sp. LCG004 TaxID=3079304 RepID=UPI0029425647|nr:biopolymer transporter ExbD [Palleronia sp. LCG004]WOI55003.1 biopolymer transporter ExbD [Palleronia sp. LCG004]